MRDIIGRPLALIWGLAGLLGIIAADRAVARVDVRDDLNVVHVGVHVYKDSVSLRDSTEVPSGSHFRFEAGSVVRIDSGATVIINGYAFTYAQTGYLIGVTPGTLTASKAAIVDADARINQWSVTDSLTADTAAVTVLLMPGKITINGDSTITFGVAGKTITISGNVTAGTAAATFTSAGKLVLGADSAVTVGATGKTTTVTGALAVTQASAFTGNVTGGTAGATFTSAGKLVLGADSTVTVGATGKTTTVTGALAVTQASAFTGNVTATGLIIADSLVVEDFAGLLVTDTQPDTVSTPGVVATDAPWAVMTDTLATVRAYTITDNIVFIWAPAAGETTNPHTISWGVRRPK